MKRRVWRIGDLAAIDDALLVFTCRGWLDLFTGHQIPNQNISRDALHPLALIDPEAAIPDEWVRVFDTACTATDRDVIRSGLAALFAHIAAPPEPKPEEPRQHMAVVRDEDGVEWCRIQIGPTPWRSGAGEYRDWADLDVPADGVLWGGVE